MEVRLGPELYSAYRIIQNFYIDNDALPTPKTLARLLRVENKTAKEILNRLRTKRVIAKNSQNGYMWVRSRQIVCTNPRLAEARYNLLISYE